MADEEGKALSVLVRMQEPGECSSQQALALEAGVAGYILRASNDELMEPDEYEREVTAGLGFDRAS